MADAPTCSALALAMDEPLQATASRIRHWLLVEQPGRWGHHALLDSELPREVGEHLAIEGHRHGVRVLLIKRRSRRPGGPRRCFAAFTGRRERRLITFQIDAPQDLLDLDLGALARDRWSGLGEEIGGPLFAVCTHGKHDQCCARLGAPLLRALSHRDDTWEVTHVGGDRFAGNLLAFPHGLYFGRVTAEAAGRVVEAYEAGRIALDHFRGRSAFTPAAQAAEHHLRAALGVDGVDDLVLTSHRPLGPLHRVDFMVRGEARVVEVEEVLLETRPLTCKSGVARAPRSFVLRELS
ncbi:MAG TPA: sucrase ferredoxin [Actinomycetota bacterium]